MSLIGLLTQRATIQRWTRTVDDYGEIAPSWSDSSTDVPCLVQQKNGRVAMGDAGREYEFSAVGFFRPGVDIQPQSSDDSDGDRIVVDSGTYQVRGVADETGKNKMLTAYLERA
jgi:head-tail adaptor